MFKGSSDAAVFYPGAITAVKSGGIYFGETYLSGVSEAHVGEWDIVNPDGRTLIRGWKAVLRNIVKSGYATKAAVESVFECSIGNPRMESPAFRRCGCPYQRGAACRHGEAGKMNQVQTQEALRKELENLPGITEAEIREFDRNGRTVATVQAEIR